MSHYKHLTPIEREKIFLLYSQNKTLTYIANTIHRDKSTVSREITRNSCNGAYSPNTAHATLYNTLLNKIGSLPKGKEFVLRELIATPPALIGRWFYENVNNGLVKNVEHIGKAEGGVEKYKRI